MATMKGPKPGDTVTFHRVTSLEHDAPIEDVPAKVVATTFIEGRETPLLALEIKVGELTELLRNVSRSSEHPDVGGRGCWSERP